MDSFTTARRSVQPRRTPLLLAALPVLALALGGLVSVRPASAATQVKPVLTFRGPLGNLRLPGTLSASATITSTATLTGELKISLYPPVGPLADHTCKNVPVQVQTQRLNATAGSVSLTRALTVAASQGVWGVQASYAGDAANEAVTSPCASSLVLAPDTEWTPEQPGTDQWLPFRSAQALVDRQYRDFLGRAPTTTEQSQWVAKLTAAQASRGDLVESLRRTDDNVKLVDPVTRLYQAYFLRTPDAPGLDHWVAKHRAGQSLSSISEHFATSSEFKTRYGALATAAFVDLVYRNVLGRAPDQRGAAFWKQQLDTGKRSRGAVMVGFSESPEYRKVTRHKVDVAVLFAFMLERAPAKAELEGFVALLSLGPDASVPFTVADMAEELFEHGDYAGRL